MCTSGLRPKKQRFNSATYGLRFGKSRCSRCEEALYRIQHEPMMVTRSGKRQATFWQLNFMDKEPDLQSGHTKDWFQRSHAWLEYDMPAIVAGPTMPIWEYALVPFEKETPLKKPKYVGGSSGWNGGDTNILVSELADCADILDMEREQLPAGHFLHVTYIDEEYYEQNTETFLFKNRREGVNFIKKTLCRHFMNMFETAFHIKTEVAYAYASWIWTAKIDFSDCYQELYEAHCGAARKTLLEAKRTGLSWLYGRGLPAEVVDIIKDIYYEPSKFFPTDWDLGKVLNDTPMLFFNPKTYLAKKRLLESGDVEENPGPSSWSVRLFGSGGAAVIDTVADEWVEAEERKLDMLTDPEYHHLLHPPNLDIGLDFGTGAKDILFEYAEGVDGEEEPVSYSSIPDIQHGFVTLTKEKQWKKNARRKKLKWRARQHGLDLDDEEIAALKWAGVKLGDLVASSTFVFLARLAWISYWYQIPKLWSSPWTFVELASQCCFVWLFRSGPIAGRFSWLVEALLSTLPSTVTLGWVPNIACWGPLVLIDSQFITGSVAILLIGIFMLELWVVKTILVVSWGVLVALAWILVLVLVWQYHLSKEAQEWLYSKYEAGFLSVLGCTPERAAYVFELLNDAPAPTQRKKAATSVPAQSLWVPKWVSEVFFPAVRGDLKPLSERLRKNAQHMADLLNLAEPLTIVDTQYEFYSDWEARLATHDFKEFEPMFPLDDATKARLRAEAPHSKFAKQMPGSMQVCAETSSSWHQRPLKNVAKNASTGVVGPAYNTTYLSDTAWQILSTSRYKKGDDDVKETYSWLSYLEPLYEILRPWFQNSQLQSFEKCLRDYSFSYNLGFGAMDRRGRAYKRNRLFQHLGGKIRDRADLKRLFLQEVIPNLHEYAQISEVFMKEEVQPIEKWPKCRTILGASFWHHLPALMVGGEPNHRAAYDSTPICVGMPLTGRYLAPIFKEALSCPFRAAGDMEAYDSRVMEDLLDLMAALRAKGYEDHQSKDAIESFLQIYYQSLKCDPMHIKEGGLCVTKERGLATGHAYTSMDNSFMFHAQMYRALDGLLPEMSPAKYKEWFYFPDYADDNFICFRRSDIKMKNGENLTFEAISTELKKYNMNLKLENPGVDGRPDDKLLSFLGNCWREPTLEERDRLGIDMVIYHDEERLLRKFQLNFKARTPLRQLERCSGYVRNCAHLPYAYQCVQDEVAAIVRKNPHLRNHVHYKNATIPLAEVERLWYAPLKDKHELRLLNLVHADLMMVADQPAPAWSLREFLDAWEQITEAVPVMMSGVGFKYLGAYNVTKLFGRKMVSFIAALAAYYNVDIAGLIPILTRLGVQVVDYKGLVSEFGLISAVNEEKERLLRLSPKHRSAAVGPYIGALKLYHLLIQFTPKITPFNAAARLIGLFNISLKKLASLDFLLTGQPVDFNEYEIFNPINAAVFAVCLVLAEMQFIAEASISTPFQQMLDEADAFFQKTVNVGIGTVVCNLKARFIPEVKNYVDRCTSLDSVIQPLLTKEESFRQAAEEAVKLGRETPKLKNQLLVAPTGFGKSTWFLRRLLQRREVSRLICIIPKRVAVLSNRAFMEKQCDFRVGAWCEGSTMTDGRLIYSTPDAFMLRYKRTDPNTFIVVDEAHHLENGYRDFVKFLTEQSKFNRTLCMTATPDEYLSGFTRFAPPKFEGSTRELAITHFRCTQKQFFDACTEEVQKKASYKVLIIANTTAQLQRIQRQVRFRTCELINSKKPAFSENSQIYLATNVVDCAVTVPDVERVLCTDLDCTVDNGDFLYWTTTQQVIRQRAGRTGRNCDGAAFVFHITDRGGPRPAFSDDLWYQDHKALLTCEDFYETLDSQKKQYLMDTHGLFGPLDPAKYLADLAQELDSSISAQETKGEIKLARTERTADSIYRVKSDPEFYQAVLEGHKTMELRLYEKQALEWKLYDTLTVLNSQDQSKSVKVMIKSLETIGPCGNQWDRLSTDPLGLALAEYHESIMPGWGLKAAEKQYLSFPGYKDHRTVGVVVIKWVLLEDPSGRLRPEEVRGVIAHNLGGQYRNQMRDEAAEATRYETSDVPEEIKAQIRAGKWTLDPVPEGGFRLKRQNEKGYQLGMTNSMSRRAQKAKAKE